MAKLVLAIGDGIKGSGKTFKIELEGEAADQLFNKKIGETVKLAETKDNELTITGGTDASGFPMRKDVEGAIKKKIFVAGGTGYRPKRKGCKDRRTVSGNTIYEGTAQVNLKVVKAGKETLADIFAPKEEATEEAKEE